MKSKLSKLNYISVLLEKCAKFRGPELEENKKKILPLLDDLENDLDNDLDNDLENKKMLKLVKATFSSIRNSLKRSFKYDWKGYIILGVLITTSFSIGCLSTQLYMRGLF